MSRDEEPITKNKSGSWAGFYTESIRIGNRFTVIAFAQERNGMPSTLVEVTRGLSDESHKLADRFQEWPKLPPGAVGEERNQKINRLLDLNRICEELASKTLGVPPIPQPPRPPLRVKK